MAPIMKSVVQPKVRLSPKLHRRLATAARRNNASLNGEIVRRLELSLQVESLEARFDAFERRLLTALADRTIA
jgi:HicB family